MSAPRPWCVLARILAACLLSLASFAEVVRYDVDGTNEKLKAVYSKILGSPREANNPVSPSDVIVIRKAVAKAFKARPLDTRTIDAGFYLCILTHTKDDEIGQVARHLIADKKPKVISQDHYDLLARSMFIVALQDTEDAIAFLRDCVTGKQEFGTFSVKGKLSDSARLTGDLRACAVAALAATSPQLALPVLKDLATKYPVVSGPGLWEPNARIGNGIVAGIERLEKKARGETVPGDTY